MLAQQYWEHQSLDGRTPEDRILEAGYDFYSSGENLSLAMSTTPKDEVERAMRAHDGLFIDHGFSWQETSP